MPMTPFFTRFPELASREMRVLTLKGAWDVPAGEYAFVELYCDEPDCDCRRVVINVLGKATGAKIWATINYGWEPPEFYAAWIGHEESGAELSEPMLDPLNPQTEYSAALLRFFKGIILDKTYVGRLERHYRMFKAELKREVGARPVRRSRPKRSRPRAARAPRRESKP